MRKIFTFCIIFLIIYPLYFEQSEIENIQDIQNETPNASGLLKEADFYKDLFLYIFHLPSIIW